MHAAADGCCISCHLQVSKLCVFSEQKQKQHIKLVLDLSARMTASNMLVQDYVVMAFNSVLSCSPVTYYTANKLPASVSNSPHL